MDLDRAFQQALRKRWQAQPSGGCPSEADLAGYLAGELVEAARHRVQAHLESCPICLDAVAMASEASCGKDADLSDATLHQLRDRLGLPAQAPRPARWKRHRWLFLSLVSFGCSFVMPHHFLQWLALTLVFGGKWVFDAASTRALVMIYESVRKDRPPTRLHHRDAEKIS